MGLAKVLHDEKNKKCDNCDDDAGKDREPPETWAALSKMIFGGCTTRRDKKLT
jgi:hypothetical protein